MVPPLPELVLTPAADAELTRAAIALTAARHVVALTGAGPSLESGAEGAGA